MYNSLTIKSYYYMILLQAVSFIILGIIIGLIVMFSNFETLIYAIIIGVYLVFFIINFAVQYWRYRFYGYYYTNKEVAVKTGYFFQSYKYMPYSRVQQIEVNASAFERMFKIATISFTTAGTVMRIRYLDFDKATDIRKEIIEYVGDLDE